MAAPVCRIVGKRSVCINRAFCTLKAFTHGEFRLFSSLSSNSVNGLSEIRNEKRGKWKTNTSVPEYSFVFAVGLGVAALCGVSSWLYHRRYLCKDIRDKFRFNLYGQYLFKNNAWPFIVQAAKPYESDPGEVPQGTQNVNKYSDGGSKIPPSMRYNFIADVVDKISPGVVYIEIKGHHPWHGGMVTLSNGSGFIVSEDGLIVTNAHVVANSIDVIVKLQNGQVYQGVVEDIDHVADLAAVRIKCNKLPILNLGDSSKIRAGEWVVAMGSPLSLSNTITSGIISAVNRESKELGLQKDMDYIQTDAAINFGNSGGPLVNLDGNVIGVNTMKVTSGISFAIPIDYVKHFLKKNKERKSGWFGTESQVSSKRFIGITMLTLTPRILSEMRQLQPDFPVVSSGVLVWKVVDGSPAYLGGIRPGDVVTDVNKVPVKTSSDIYKAIEKSEGKLILTVLRKNRTLKLTVLPVNM